MLRRVAKAGSGGGVSGSRSPFSGPVERLMRGFGLDCQGGVGEAEGGEGGRGRVLIPTRGHSLEKSMAPHSPAKVWVESLWVSTDQAGVALRGRKAHFFSEGPHLRSCMKTSHAAQKPIFVEAKKNK